MGENEGVLPLLRVPHHTTPMYMQLLSFTAFLRAQKGVFTCHVNSVADTN